MCTNPNTLQIKVNASLDFMLVFVKGTDCVLALYINKKKTLP